MAMLRVSTGLICLAALAALPALASADRVTFRRDSVIPVVFEDSLTVSGNHEGDMFTVRVADTDLLPKGTEILGRIDHIHPPKGRRPASMDLRFTKLLLPDNSRVSIDAVPLPLEDKYITRSGDGRIMAKQDIRKQQGDVIGGAIGGFIVGSIFHHRVAGAIIGTIVGAAAAGNERSKDNNEIVTSGEKVGALMNRDVTIDFGGVVDRLSVSGVPRRDGDVSQDRGHDREDHHSDIVVSWKRRDLEFPSDARPYRIGDTVMVALEPIASQMGLDVDRRKDHTIYVDGDDMNLRLSENSRQARLNGDRIQLPRTVAVHDGVVYVPLDVLVMISKDHFQVNGVKYDDHS